MPLLDDTEDWGNAGLLTDQFWKNIPPALQYFTKDWLKQQPSTQMQYLEGWQPEMAPTSWTYSGGGSPDYNIPLAYLNRMPEAVQWEDEGLAGSRWHGYSTTPGGQWLKSPWHPTYYMNDMLQLQKMMQQLPE